MFISEKGEIHSIIPYLMADGVPGWVISVDLIGYLFISIYHLRMPFPLAPGLLYAPCWS